MVDIPIEFLTEYVPSTNKLGTLPLQPAFHFLRIIEFRGVTIKVFCGSQDTKKLNCLSEGNLRGRRPLIMKVRCRRRSQRIA